MSIISGGDQPRKGPSHTAPQFVPGASSSVSGTDDVLTAALTYLDHGFAIVPQRAGDKKPCVRWKAYQERQPTREEMTDWFSRQFRGAGLAVVLGPVSDLFVIDVDGPEAHAALVARLGSEPIAPKVLSGSDKPFRHHLFFRHPSVDTRAKITPWHPKLEFRGNKGIVVLPPSVHKSRMRYRWAPGHSLDDIALTDVPDAVLQALVERAAQDAVQSRHARGSVIAPNELSRVQQRARNYLAKLPPAVAGHGGDMQTFTVACHLVIGFGLSTADALPLMREYNQRCQPPWTDAELLHKLHEADKRGGIRGTLAAKSPAALDLQGEIRAIINTTPYPASEAFVGSVPDFAQADWLMARPSWGARDSEGRRPHGRPRIGGGFHWAIHLAVIAQRSARVVLPDVLLGQLFWGSSARPRNWRQHVRETLRHWTGGPESPFIEVTVEKTNACPAQCALHGSTLRHRHIYVLIRTAQDLVDADRLDDEGEPHEDAWLSRVFLGVLELYGFDSTNGERAYDFTLQSQRQELDEEAFKALESRLKRFRRQGRLVSAYMPIRLLGGCSTLGLMFQPRQLLLAIHRELTRDRRSERPDKASVIVPGKPAGAVTGFAIDHYDGLEEGQRYVGFNGNGGKRRERLRGRGYRVVGANGWLMRARYFEPGDTTDMWKAARKFFRDLERIAYLFGLVIAARHRRRKDWLGLEHLAARTRTPSGRNWLGECVLRIYTADDYLSRWRQVLEQQTGLVYIPDPDKEQTVIANRCSTPVQLMDYLSKAGISQNDLALALGISKSLLSQYLNGHKTWTAAWQQRLDAWIVSRQSPEST